MREVPSLTLPFTVAHTKTHVSLQNSPHDCCHGAMAWFQKQGTIGALPHSNVTAPALGALRNSDCAHRTGSSLQWVRKS